MRILKAQELKDGADIAKLIQDYEAECGAVATAEAGLARRRHRPAGDRQMVASALEMLMGKREVALPRKHGNLPL